MQRAKENCREVKRLLKWGPTRRKTCPKLESNDRAASKLVKRWKLSVVHCEELNLWRAPSAAYVLEWRSPGYPSIEPQCPYRRKIAWWAGRTKSLVSVLPLCNSARYWSFEGHPGSALVKYVYTQLRKAASGQNIGSWHIWYCQRRGNDSRSMLPTSQAQALVGSGCPRISARTSKESIFVGKIETQGRSRISDAVLEEYW